jgi:hypothetical protein
MLLGGPFDESSCHSRSYLSLSTFHPPSPYLLGFSGVLNNAVYVVSGKVSVRVRNVTSRRHRRKMSESVARLQKNTKTLIFFNFLNL